MLVGDGRVVGGMCEPEGLVTPWHGPPSRAVKLLSEAQPHKYHLTMVVGIWEAPTLPYQSHILT